MKQYEIPITYEAIEYFSVEAESLGEAVKLALLEFFSIPDDKYIEDTFDVDHVGLEENYKEEYNWNKILNEI